LIKRVTLCFFLSIPFLPAQTIHYLSADRFTTYTLSDWISYATTLNISAVEIDNNYVYFASLSGGILRYDKYRNHWDFPFTTSSGLRSNRVLNIVYNPDDGFLYAQTSLGIDVYKTAEKYWRPADVQSLPHRQKSFSRDGPGSVQDRYRFPPLYRPGNSELPDFFTPFSLMYHLGGYVYDRENRQFNFTDRVVDAWRRLWIGTDGLGPMMAELDQNYLNSLRYSIPSISPRDVYTDGNDMWVGGLHRNASPAGISHWDRERDEWEYFEAPFLSSLYSDEVLSIDGNQDYIAFATTQGLALLDKKKKNWKTFDTRLGLEGSYVLDVLPFQNRIYTATEYGLNWLNLASMDIEEPAQSELDNVYIHRLAEDGQMVWAATRFGLYQINPETDQVLFIASRAALPDYDLRALDIIGKEIWVANQRGIAYWNRESDEWRSFPALNLPSETEIRDITHTNKNTIWFATSSGLLKYDRKQDYWRMYTTEDGLISNDAYRLDLDGKHIWVATRDGISAFQWRRKGRLD
jgi:ligand-binding sensor domain-containing protein